MQNEDFAKKIQKIKFSKNSHNAQIDGKHAEKIKFRLFFFYQNSHKNVSTTAQKNDMRN